MTLCWHVFQAVFCCMQNRTKALRDGCYCPGDLGVSPPLNHKDKRWRTESPSESAALRRQSCKRVPRIKSPSETSIQHSSINVKRKPTELTRQSDVPACAFTLTHMVATVRASWAFTAGQNILRKRHFLVNMIIKSFLKVCSLHLG